MKAAATVTAMVLFGCALAARGQGTSPVDATWMEVDGVQVPVPPPEHPRLYLRARDVPDLARRTTHPRLEPVWRRLLEYGITNAQVRVETGAARYLLERDADAGRRVAAEALATLQQAYSGPQTGDNSRAIGRMMVTGAIVYDWCYDLLTGEQKNAFVAEFVRLAKMLECGYPPVSRGFVTGHFSEWMIMRDMLSAGIAIYDEEPRMYQLAAHRFFAGVLPVRNWWYPGHGFHQGSAYNETRWVSDMYPLWIFDRMGAGNVYHPAQQFVPYEWIYRRRPDGQLLRSGDGQSRSPRLGALLTASYYGDGYVLGNYLVDPGIDDMNKIWELLWRDPDGEARDFSDLPLSRYLGFPYGWMLARTGWTGEAVIAELKVNAYNFINHQHLDAGAFQIFYKGPLAIDSGLYEGSAGGYESPHDASYNKRTIAHNSLLIYDPEEKFISGSSTGRRNDGGQRLPNNWREAGLLDDLLTRGYETGEVLGYGFGPDPQTPKYTYLKGDITRAYSAKVRQAQRSFVFLNLLEPAVPAALVVFDRVVSSNPAFKKYWLLHTLEEPSIEGARSIVTLSERSWIGKLVNTTLLPPSAEIAKTGGPGREFWVFGENFPNEPTSGNPRDYELGAWRLEISPSAEAETDFFLNVMQVTDTAASAVHAVDKIEGKDIVGVQLAGRVVLFSSTGRRLERPVSFTVKGESDLEFLVTDLAEGTWQVWRAGRILHPALVVTHDAGTLYFKGPAGGYSLRR